MNSPKGNRAIFVPKLSPMAPCCGLDICPCGSVRGHFFVPLLYPVGRCSWPLVSSRNKKMWPPLSLDPLPSVPPTVGLLCPHCPLLSQSCPWPLLPWAANCPLDFARGIRSRPRPASAFQCTRCPNSSQLFPVVPHGLCPWPLIPSAADSFAPPLFLLFCTPGYSGWSRAAFCPLRG